MKSSPDNLTIELEHQLNYLHVEIEDPLRRADEAVRVILSLLEKLKVWCFKYKFSSQQEEIAFFRFIKPRFTSQLIYYHSLYNLESNKLSICTNQSKYYKKELIRINSFFKQNATFYRYYVSGDDYLDHKYFIRGRHDLRLNIDNSYFQSDLNFSTSHDYKAAQILANERIIKYIKSEIDKREPVKSFSDGKPLKWTGSKVGIVELIYALHTEGVFNHGVSELKDLIRIFSKTFDIDLTQYHRTFHEISSRKSDRTKFLQNLNSNLLRRMDETNGYK